MEKDDKGSTLIRIGVRGESSFWYRPTRVVPDQRPVKRSLLFVVVIKPVNQPSSVSAITAKSSAYSSSHGRATLNSLDMASMTITMGLMLNLGAYPLLPQNLF